MLAVVTKVVHEFILGTDFLTEVGCKCDFGAARVQFNGNWVLLHKRDAPRESKYVCVSQDCRVPHEVQAEALAEVCL